MQRKKFGYAIALIIITLFFTSGCDSQSREFFANSLVSSKFLRN